MRFFKLFCNNSNIACFLTIGVGKSSLALEICKPLNQRRGYLIKGMYFKHNFFSYTQNHILLFFNQKGKYDQLRRSEPYSALLTAFWNFFDVLLAGSSSVLNYFVKKIKKAIGSDGRVLTNIIGNLDRIIGT